MQNCGNFKTVEKVAKSSPQKSYESKTFVNCYTSGKNSVFPSLSYYFWGGIFWNFSNGFESKLKSCYFFISLLIFDPEKNCVKDLLTLS